jgi:hypothetical protein
MPFTPTHALAILPIARWIPRLSLSALATGSMIPDLPLFLPIGISYLTMHTFLGVLTTCIPVGLIALFLFHRYIKQAVLLLSPLWIRSRLHAQEYSEKRWEPTEVAWDSVALALGAVTHIVWDAFTHEGRWGVQLFPALNSLFEIAGFHIHAYKLFQHGSSLIGLPLMALAAGLWRAKQSSRTPVFILRPALKTSIIASIAVICIVFAVAAGMFSAAHGLEIMAFYIATRFIGSLCILLLLVGIAIDGFSRQLVEDYSETLDS